MLMTSLLLLQLLQVLEFRKGMFLLVTDSATPRSDNAPWFLFSITGDKEQLKLAVHAKAEPLGQANLFLQDNEGYFMAWNDPTPLPTSGTIRVKVKVAKDSAGNQSTQSS